MCRELHALRREAVKTKRYRPHPGCFDVIDPCAPALSEWRPLEAFGDGCFQISCLRFLKNLETIPSYESGDLKILACSVPIPVDLWICLNLNQLSLSFI